MSNSLRFFMLAWCFPVLLFSQSKPQKKYPSTQAYLSLSTNRDTLMEGECATLSFSFNVKYENRAPIRFLDLDQQLHDLQIYGLAVGHCFQVDSRIADVVGEPKFINGDSVMVYTIYQASYCPFKAEDIRFPALKLKLLQPKIDSKSIYGPSDTLTFKSDPVFIKVNALPATAVPVKLPHFNIVGDFKMDERLSENPKAGAVVYYYVTLHGTGLLFPVEPPVLKVDGAFVTLRDIKDHCWLTHGKFMSDKIFTYALLFQNAGPYDLANKISVSYFNPANGKPNTLRSNKKVVVEKGETDEVPKAMTSLRHKTKFIAVDVSTSMSLEDYKPNRLSVVKSGLTKFLSDQKSCDLGMIVFENKAWHLFPPDSDPCNVKTTVDDINLIKGFSGTSMGDAIWLAQNSFTPDSTQQKILVIIGDGDNTGGVITPKFAAQLARRHNIKIFTIGIGKKDPVRHRKDNSDETVLLENTFFDGHLKAISQTTGGKYFYAKDAQQLSDILNVILK